jgi:hypothetical protein
MLSPGKPEVPNYKDNQIQTFEFTPKKDFAAYIDIGISIGRNMDTYQKRK